MATKRSSRKARKRAREKLRNTPPLHLFDQGRQRLAKEDARGALDLFKQAQHGDDSLEGLPLQLFCAGALRARQLAEKGMIKEAAAMRGLADGHRASIALGGLGADDLAQYIDYLDGPEAFQVYAEYLRDHPPLSHIDRFLADLLVIHRCWEAIGRFDPDHPLRRDVEVIRQAVASMEVGSWEQAGISLKDIGRRSPYAAWRLFCKAMVCFGAEDDQGLRQAVDLLPEDFALGHTVAEWKSICAGEAEEKRPAVSLRVRQALGTDGGAVAQLAEQLRQAIWKQQLRDIERLLPRLAEAIYPEDPLQARIALLQIVGLADLPPHSLHNLLQRLLPRERLPAVIAQIGLQIQEKSPDRWNVAPATIYLEQLPLEFPEARTQALARGRVLESLARTGHRAGVMPYMLPPLQQQALARITGERIGDPGTLFANLMAASLEADPENREGYRFLLDLLRGRTSNKSKLGKILDDMVARFPDDPQPCLELATLHYSRNAYRKAEAVLAEAGKRAPYDERILDLQAIGHLKSADQNRKRGHFQRTVEDLQCAADLKRSRIAPLLQEKQLMLEVVSSDGEIAAAISSHLDALPPAQQLRMLAVLIHDLEENSNVKNVRAAMANELQDLLQRRAGLFDQLNPGEVVELLSPLEGDLAILFDDLQVAPALEDYWTPLFERVGGGELIALFDILLDCGKRPVVRAEIDRRLQGAKKSHRDPLLLFYLAVIRYLEGKDYDSRRFQEVLGMVDAARREELRAAALRLSRHAQGHLRQALQEFRFEMLDMAFPFARGGLPPLEDILRNVGPELNELDFDEERFSGVGDILDELDGLEQMIDEHEMRGAPASQLRDLAGSLRTRAQTRQDLARIARQCEAEDLVDELSPELLIILFPRKRKGGLR